MKTISIFNQKGGVGKTTTVVNLAVGLSYLEKEVLVIDMDPQANATTGLGINKNKIETSIYDLFYMLDEEDILDKEDNDTEVLEDDQSEKEDISNEEEKTPDFFDKFIINTNSGVDLLASENSLSGLEVELVPLDPIERTKKLKEIIGRIDKKYDYVLIDCPPSLGLLSINALVASDSIIIPIQTEYYALEGVSELMNTFELVKESINPDLYVEGVLLSMFDKRTKLSYEVVEEVKKYFKDRVFMTMIPRNVRLAEAPSHGKSAVEYEPKSQGAMAYISLADEIIKND